MSSYPTRRIQGNVAGRGTESLAGAALLFEEFLAREQDAGTLSLDLRPLPAGQALVHGHCHQKAFAVMDSMEAVLRLVPELEVEIIESGCCGMAGAFGYDAGNYDISMKMAERDLLPAVRAATSSALMVANGTSCRHQIRDGTGREVLHAARVLESALEPTI